MGQNFSWPEQNGHRLDRHENDDDEQETSTTKTDVFAFASRSKAKAKPRTPSTACSSSRTVLILERIWIDTRSSIRSSLPNGKKNKHSASTRRTTSRRRWSDESWRLKDDLRNKFEYSQYWSDDSGRARWQEAEATRKRFQYCTDSSGQEILYLRALQGHSGRNPIDPTLQDNVLIPNSFFEYIYHIGCAVILHSITNSGLIARGQNSRRERQTVFFTAVNPMHNNHQDPIELDLTKPRLASYKQKWKRHQGYGLLGRHTACSTEKD